jgi:hypothetical protein
MLYFKFFTHQNKIQLGFLPTMNKLNWVFYSLYMTCIVFLLQVYQALKMYTSSFILLMYIILYSLNVFHWCRWYVHVKKKSWEGVLSHIPIPVNLWELLGGDLPPTNSSKGEIVCVAFKCTKLYLVVAYMW